MTERGAGQVAREAQHFQVGPSSMHWDGTTLVVAIDEIAVPHLGRVRGQVRLHPVLMTDHVETIDSGGRHRWTPFAPSARVEVDLPKPGVSWSGHGYFDGNHGDRPLEADFSTWTWSRASMPDGAAAVLYDVQRRDGSELALALHFARDGVGRFASPPLARLPGTLWGVDRVTRSDGAALVLQTMEAAPFYTRSAIETELLGARVQGVHESLVMDRFTARWVQTLLPFRMPRIAR
jgi:carotenoid 1,2-hydratase